jgi:TPR repeat protein
MAQTNLGAMYENGQGTARDYVRAHMWYNLSSVQGDQQALKNRDTVAKRMTPAQIAEAQELARVWKPNTQRLRP